ncbi:formyltetrahydrofolate-dependent phosphoribosylglycinamide formyltransferase [Paraglaciecola sp. T6c]|uniref:phosphoribosylglycinamide formyltransferase n=1 Tax=Pseudoalteromonas atlantica (strain T6c / ATCC BAA-1087) TaxID=3042615 RepID=UPI00005C68AC|nr:phosphoribosylglycinamide formyltransferase [Paraglaciecola sp. T6c]ABG41006.1 formyltetrahydrofolate-dependent phosphoribosylglycinamide formyltransferase [Paraglaciecola sp. T6c]
MTVNTDITKIVVLISGNGSNLQALIDDIAEQKITAQIVAVISNKADAYGLERASQANIPHHVVSHKDYATRDEYDAQLHSTIASFSPDLVVLAGFMRILTPWFVEQFTGKMLNIHPSLLPKYKGLDTHQRAIDAKDEEHGASVHFVTPELDGGPVVLQSKVPVFADENASQLASRVQEQERQMYPLVVRWFCQKRLLMLNNKAYLDGNEIPITGYAAD